MVKKISKILISIALVCFILVKPSMVHAGSVYISGPSSVNPGETFSITIGGLSDIRGPFNISVSNGTLNGNPSFYSRGTDETYSITAGSKDAVSIFVSATSDALYFSTEESAGGEGASIGVKINSSSTGGNVPVTNPNPSSSSSSSSNSNQTEQTTQTKEETPKSSNSNLSSITLDHGNLQPGFDPNTTDYTVDLDYTYTSIHVEASVEDSKASIIQGTGDHELNAGENLITVGVKAEDNSIKAYNINVKVQASPDLTLKLDNEDYKVISNYKDVTLPETFEDSKITINDVEVRCVRSQTYNLVLLYLNKGDENKFYIYDEASNKVLGEYVTLSYNEKIYVVYPVDEGQKNKKGFMFTTMTIQDKDNAGWKYEDEKEADFFVIYLVNDQGAKEYYRYDTVENSLQRLESELTIVQDQLDPVILYVIGGAVALVVLGILGYVFISKKRKVQFERRGKLQEEEYEFSQEEVEDDED